MRAVVHHEFGGPEVLRLTEVPTPEPREGELLIRVHASSVTQGDRRLRAADYPGVGALIGRLLFGVFRPRHPVVGTNFSGVVVAVGKGVRQWRPGDAVFGSADHGACADFLVLKQSAALARKPSSLNHAEAAALPYGAVTALVFLRDIGQLRSGEKVAVVGASGGVGRFAVQMARALGAEVTGVCSREKAQLVAELGATRVIGYDEWQAESVPYDLIFDTHSGDGVRQAKARLNAGGRFVTLYMSTRIVLEMLFARFKKGPRARAGVALPSAALLEEVAELTRCGDIWPVVSQRFELTQAVEAHAALEDRKTSGTVVVLLQEEDEAT